MKRERISFNHRMHLVVPEALSRAMQMAAARSLVTPSEYVRHALRAQLRRDHVPIGIKTGDEVAA